MKKQFSAKRYKIKAYSCHNKIKSRFLLYEDLYELRGILRIALERIDKVLGIADFKNVEKNKGSFSLK